MKDKKKNDLVEEKYKNKDNTFPNQDQYDTEKSITPQNSCAQCGQIHNKLTGGGG